jgi:hypothetical protein
MRCKLEGCGQKIPCGRKSHDKSFCCDEHRDELSRTSASIARETDALVENRGKTRREWIQIGAASVSALAAAGGMYFTYRHSRTLEQGSPTGNNRTPAQVSIQGRYEFPKPLKLGRFSGSAPKGWEIDLPPAGNYVFLLCQEVSDFRVGQIRLRCEIRKHGIRWVFHFQDFDNHRTGAVVLTAGGPLLEFQSIVNGQRRKPEQIRLSSSLSVGQPFDISFKLNEGSSQTAIGSETHTQEEHGVQGGRVGLCSANDQDSLVYAVALS